MHHSQTRACGQQWRPRAARHKETNPIKSVLFFFFKKRYNDLPIWYLSSSSFPILKMASLSTHFLKPETWQWFLEFPFLSPPPDQQPKSSPCPNPINFASKTYWRSIFWSLHVPQCKSSSPLSYSIARASLLVFLFPFLAFSNPTSE